MGFLASVLESGVSHCRIEGDFLVTLRFHGPGIEDFLIGGLSAARETKKHWRTKRGFAHEFEKLPPVGWPLGIYRRGRVMTLRQVERSSREILHSASMPRVK